MKISALGGHINMSWSPSGHYLALSNKSDYLAVFDVRTGTMVKKKKVHYEVRLAIIHRCCISLSDGEISRLAQ